MDEGLPIAYDVVEPDIAVLASGGEQVGTVDHVVSAPEEDIFHGLVIRTDNKGSHTSRITVRRIASGVGVEKSFLLHSPLVVQVDLVVADECVPACLEVTADIFR